MQDGRVLQAVEEERLSRIKHGKRPLCSNADELPARAIECCLEQQGAALREVDAVAVSFAPGLRQQTLGHDPLPLDPETGFGSAEGEAEFDARLRSIPKRFACPVHFVPHHVAHAASAFFPSPFERAAVLVVDGIAERSSAWLGRGTDHLQPMDEVPYPHSLGLLWERVAIYLGFTEYDAAKVMGLAAYGDPTRFSGELARLLRILAADGGEPGTLPFELDPLLARLRSPDVAGLESLFGPRRNKDEPIDAPRFAAVAAALQRRTEEAILALARRLHRATGEPDLVYAGGVALNCVANARLEREGPFERLYIPGAAHDAGTAMGAALQLGGQRARPLPELPLTPFLGPTWGGAAIDAALSRAGHAAERIADAPALAAKLIAQGALVGWFEGRLELGPRALGHRSLLADPRKPEVRAELNRRVKHREAFRPFAASVTLEAAADWFELPSARPGAASCRDLMLFAYPVRAERAGSIPAVVHRDGTCRVQIVSPSVAPRFYQLIAAFGRLTSVPLVLNTSFNDSEPIVGTPDDALASFARMGLDALFVEDRLVRRPP